MKIKWPSVLVTDLIPNSFGEVKNQIIVKMMTITKNTMSLASSLPEFTSHLCCSYSRLSTSAPFTLLLLISTRALSSSGISFSPFIPESFIRATLDVTCPNHLDKIFPVSPFLFEFHPLCSSHDLFVYFAGDKVILCVCCFFYWLVSSHIAS